MNDSQFLVPCYACSQPFTPDPEKVKAWAESGKPYDPTDWECPTCFKAQSDYTDYLDDEAEDNPFDWPENNAEPYPYITPEKDGPDAGDFNDVEDPSYDEWLASYTKQQRVVQNLEAKLAYERKILDDISAAEPMHITLTDWSPVQLSPIFPHFPEEVL